MEAKKQNFECTTFDCLNISVIVSNQKTRTFQEKKNVSNHVECLNINEAAICGIKIIKQYHNFLFHHHQSNSYIMFCSFTQHRKAFSQLSQLTPFLCDSTIPSKSHFAIHSHLATKFFIGKLYKHPVGFEITTSPSPHSCGFWTKAHMHLTINLLTRA